MFDWAVEDIKSIFNEWRLGLCSNPNNECTL